MRDGAEKGRSFRRRWPGPFAGSSAGFTLVELMMVLVIIGVLVAFAAPKVDVQRYRIEGTVRSVGTTLMAAQQQAVGGQHDVVVAFDLGANALRVHDDRNNDGIVDVGERVRAVPLGEAVAFGRGSAPAASVGEGPVTFVRQSGGSPAVTFHRSGSASEAGGVYLTSRRALTTGGYPSDSRLVLVERSTGRASWLRYRDGSWRREF